MHCASPHPTMFRTEPILVLPVTPTLEIPPSGEQGTETGPSSATTIIPRGLPSNTVKADVREVGRRADVVSWGRRVFASYISNTVIRNKQVCHYATVRWSSKGSGLVLPTCTTAVSPTSMMPIPPSTRQSPTDTTPSSSPSPSLSPSSSLP
jgi:hypothetical protein